MKFPPTVTITPIIQRLLYDLDVLRASFALNPVAPEREIQLRRISLLKSSLYSARIEGNPLELSDVQSLGFNEKEIKKMEIANLVRAYGQIPRLTTDNLSIDTLLLLHREVMTGISGEAGHLRSEETAIFNQAGVAVYLTPAPQNVKELLTSLCIYANNIEYPMPVIAAVSHIWFEKIHPFLDGNGRVGRLLSAWILKKGKYYFGGLVPFEEYLDTHRDLYYDALEKDRQDTTVFTEFYLTALLEQAKISLKLAYEPVKADPFVHLLPRRAEIMRIVTDHKVVTFDFLTRRFRAVPVRTLHNDIAQLIHDGLLVRMGKTRGAMYQAAKTSD